MPLRLRRQGRFVAVAAIAGLALTGCIGAVPGPAAPVPPPVNQAALPPTGTHLVFSDNFAGTSLDTTKWDTCYPWADTGSGCTNFGNTELEWYLPSQAQVSGGALHLVASQTPTEGTTRAGAPQSYPWMSGMVTTFNSLDFTYGYVQVSARIPAGDGFWPTLWLLPQSEGWPPEIDFEESHDGDTHLTSATFHPVTGSQDQGVYTSPSDLSAGFHTFAVDWEPGVITWYVDGNVVYTHTGSDVPSQPMYFLADLAVSGGEDPPTASTPPSASFDIQNVQIYQH